MAAYRIWCRTVELGPGQFLVTVSAVPARGQEGAEAITSESRLFASSELARSEAKAMCEAMKARVIAQGHHVEALDFV